MQSNVSTIRPNDSKLTITIELKNVYGVERIKPVDANADLFCRLLGQSTLTTENIKVIKALGYEVLVKQQQFKL